MWSNQKMSVLKKQHMELELLQQHLKKVTKSNRCLICELDFPDDIAVHNHFIDIHQKGVFLCKITGCNFVANTNGDLRMHCLIWHSDHFSSSITLPQNSMAVVTVSKKKSTTVNLPVASVPVSVLTPVPKPTSEKPPEEQQPIVDKTTRQPNFPPISSNLRCSTCLHPFLTDLGINMHQRYHRYNLFLPKLKKMSDIETLDEMKEILEISNEKGDVERKLPVHYITNKENTPVRSTIAGAKQQEQAKEQKQQQQPERQPEKKQRTEQIQKKQPVQTVLKHKQQWIEKLTLNEENITRNLQQIREMTGIPKIIGRVDNPLPIQQISSNMRDIRKRPLSPAGSVVSISSSESTVNENNEIAYSCDEDIIDIEF